MRRIAVALVTLLSAVGSSLAASGASPIEHPLFVLRVGGGQSRLSETGGEVATSEMRTGRLQGGDGENWRIALDIGRFRWVGVMVVASYRRHPFQDPILGATRELQNTALSIGPNVRLIERPAFRLYAGATIAVIEEWGGLQNFRLAGSSDNDPSIHLGADFAFGKRARWGLNVEARWTDSTLGYDSSPNDDFPGDTVDLAIDPLDLTVGAVVRFP